MSLFSEEKEKQSSSYNSKWFFPPNETNNFLRKLSSYFIHLVNIFLEEHQKVFQTIGKGQSQAFSLCKLKCNQMHFKIVKRKTFGIICVILYLTLLRKPFNTI